jgi:hypothetical protein
MLTRVARGPGVTGTTGSSNRVYNEVPSGLINGVNTDSVASVAFVVGSEAVYRNGVRQKRGASCDYIVTESVPASGNFDTIRMAAPLSSGVNIAEQLCMDFDPA